MITNLLRSGCTNLS